MVKLYINRNLYVYAILLIILIQPAYIYSQSQEKNKIDPAIDSSLEADRISVIHAEAPSYPPLAVAARITGAVSISVQINPEGIVTSTYEENGHPLLRQQAEFAALKWKFNPFPRNDIRRAKLLFEFGGFLEVEDQSGIEVEYIDPFTIKILYKVNTVERIPRVDGRIPEKRCPMHQEVMATELVEIRYGLPAGFVDNGSRRAKRELARMRSLFLARETLFPESNRWVGGGCEVGAFKKSEVYFCKSCRHAEQIWFKAHPGRMTIETMDNTRERIPFEMEAQTRELEKPKKSDISRLPRLIWIASPEFNSFTDSMIWMAGISGKVSINLHINSAGTVSKAEYIEGHPLLKRVTIDACRQWKFNCSAVDDRTVRVELIYSKVSWDGKTKVEMLPYGVKMIANWLVRTSTGG